MHFMLILWRAYVQNNYFLCVDIQLFQNYLLKMLSLFSYIAFVPTSMISWLYFCRSISGISPLFHWSISLLICQYHSLDYCSLEGRWCHLPTLFFSFNVVLATLDFLPLHINFRIILCPQNTLLGFWLRLYLLHRSSCEELTFL